MVTTYLRGHLCEYRKDNNEWVYSDNKIPIGQETRQCKRCGEMPTPEGYDACLGYIPEAISVCCGHGMSEGFILF